MLRFRKLLNKVWGLEGCGGSGGLKLGRRFSRGYAKTVVLSCFQRGDRAFGGEVVNLH